MTLRAMIYATCCLAVFVLSGCATVGTVPQGPPPEYYEVTETANYRPVNIPGTQRRVAQQDAESRARRRIYEYVGSMPVGSETVNDVIARDNRLRAVILDAVRTSETRDWAVDPKCGSVQVWVRIDLNKVRSIIASCGHPV